MSKYYEAMKTAATVIDNTSRRLVEAKALERKAETEEQLHDAHAQIERAQREYDEAMHLHRLVVNLV